MDRNTIKKEIIALVDSIKKQSDTHSNEKYPSQLDLELFLHKVEKLYQKSIVFNHLSLFESFEETDIDTKREVINHSTDEKLREITPTIEVKEKDSIVQTSVPASETANNPVSDIRKETPVSIPDKVHAENPSKKSSLPDLKLQIGLNDKFQFANELFKENMQEFNIAIEQLNASETIDSAMNYIRDLKNLYEWDEESETVQRLLSVIEKRYR